MLVLDAAAVLRTTAAELVEPLRRAFAADVAVPGRAHHAVPVPGEADATLLLMPAWRPGGAVGVKVATVFPGNGARALPAVMATFVLMSGRTGAPAAVLDGGALTVLRTAAVSALAAAFLARADAKTLLMVGTGSLAPHLIAAHRAVRPIRRVLVWGRTPDKARALAAACGGEAVADLDGAAREADVISCATLSRAPLVRGATLRPGTHLDLVGGFTPDMREADDEAAARSAIYADTRDGVLAEAGDVIQPLRSGAIGAEAIRGDLADLARGAVAGRTDPDAITLFKSVGTARSDLAAAEWIAGLPRRS